MFGIESLTNGAILRIKAGEKIDSPVVQFCCGKYIRDSDRIRLLISDGIHFYSFGILASKLNKDFDDGKFKPFSIVRLDKYVVEKLNRLDVVKHVLIICEMTVLTDGDIVGQKIGNPVPWTEEEIKKSAQKPPEVSITAKKNQSLNASLIRHITRLSPYQNRWAIKPRVTLKSPNHMWSNAKGNAGLSPYQNKWIIKVRVMPKAPIRKLSNSKGVDTFFGIKLMDDSGKVRATALREQVAKYFGSTDTVIAQSHNFCKIKPKIPDITSLTNGVIPRIMAGEKVDSPVIQILCSKLVQGSDLIRVLISDGKYYNSLAMLGTQLTTEYANGKLKSFSTVRVDKYCVNSLSFDATKRIFIILEMTVLIDGDEIKQKIGMPVCYTEAGLENQLKNLNIN